MSRLHRVAVTVVVLGLLVGCIPSRAVPTMVAYASVRNFDLTLWTSRYGLSVGESVDIRFTVENVGGEDKGYRTGRQARDGHQH